MHRIYGDTIFVSLKMKFCVLISFIISSDFIYTVAGTGTMYDPPSRGVMWKYQFPVERNYDYMQLHCGGILQQEFGEKQCGVCGDPPSGPKEHEAGGKFASGIVSRYYPQGTKEITVKIELITFAKGFFEFRICKANNDSVTQKCLDDTQLPIKEGYMEGTPLRYYPQSAGDFHLTVALPPKLSCQRCVLQWRYRTGVSWGTDPKTSKEGMGVGPQEEFYNCADIRIGGPVPEALKRNLYFAPPDPMDNPVVVDKPTDRRKAIAAGTVETAVQIETSITAEEALSASQQQMELGMQVADGTEALQLGLSAGTAGVKKGLKATQIDQTGKHSASVDLQGKTGFIDVKTNDTGVRLDAMQVGMETQVLGDKVKSDRLMHADSAITSEPGMVISESGARSSSVDGIDSIKTAAVDTAAMAVKKVDATLSEGTPGVDFLSASSELPLESGIVQAIGVDISSPVNKGSLGRLQQDIVALKDIMGTQATQYVDKVPKLKETVSVLGTSSLTSSDMSKADKLEGGKAKLLPSDTLLLSPDINQTPTEDQLITLRKKSMPVDGIAAIFSGQNITGGMQHLKQAKMGTIVSNIKPVTRSMVSADMISPDTLASLAQSVTDQGGVQNVETRQTRILGGGVQEAGKETRKNDKMARMSESVVKGENQIQAELGPVEVKTEKSAIQTADTIKKTSDVLFTGKTIKGMDPVTEMNVERSLNREMPLEPPAEQINDMSSLSSSNLQSADIQDSLTANNMKTADEIYHPINSGPLHQDENKEKSHHNQTKKTEKTIQQVTTKNISLPNGSNIIETKTQTVEVKVTETTKVSSETNGVKKTSDSPSSVSEGEQAPSDLVAASQHDIVQKASPDTALPIDSGGDLGTIESGLSLKADQALKTIDQHLDTSTLNAGSAATVDKGGSGFDSVVQMALDGILQESASKKSSESMHAVKSVKASDQTDLPGTLADVKPETSADVGQSIMDSPAVSSAVSEGLSQLAKVTQESDSKTGKKPDINITSKKAKINISHGNTKRTVSEVDLSAATPEKKQPDVAFIIVGGEGQGPASTLKGLAQSMDQINQLEVPASGTYAVSAESGTITAPAVSGIESVQVATGSEQDPAVSSISTKIDLKSALDAEISAAGKDAVRRVAANQPKLSQISKGRDATSASRTVKADTGIASRKSDLTTLSDRSKSSSSLRRDKVPTAATKRSEVSFFADTRPTSPQVSGSLERATSFIGESSTSLRQGARRAGRTRERSLTTVTRLPMFPAGLTEGVPLGPDSGTVTPEMRIEFERRRRGQSVRTGGRRVSGSTRRIGRGEQVETSRRSDGSSGRLIQEDGRSRFYPATGFIGDDRTGMFRSEAASMMLAPSAPGRYRFSSGGLIGAPLVRYTDHRGRMIDSSLLADSSGFSGDRRYLPGERGMGRTRDGREIIVLDPGLERVPVTEMRSATSGREMVFRDRFGRPIIHPDSHERGGRRISASGTFSPPALRRDRTVARRPTSAARTTSFDTIERRAGQRATTGQRPVAVRGDVGEMSGRQETRPAPGPSRISASLGSGRRGIVASSEDARRMRLSRLGGGMSTSSAAATTRSSLGGGGSSGFASRTGLGSGGQLRLGRVSSGEIVRPPGEGTRYFPFEVPYTTDGRMLSGGGGYIIPPVPYPGMGISSPMFGRRPGPVYPIPSGPEFMRYPPFPYTPMGPML